jgi:signal transduction histidine kinase
MIRPQPFRGSTLALILIALLVGSYGLDSLIHFLHSPYLGIHGVFRSRGYEIRDVVDAEASEPLGTGGHVVAVEGRSIEEWLRVLLRVHPGAAPSWAVGIPLTLEVVRGASAPREIRVVPRLPSAGDLLAGPIWRWSLATLILLCGTYLLIRNPGEQRIRVLSVILLASALSIYNRSGQHLALQMSPQLPLSVAISLGTLCLIFSSWLFLILIFLERRGHFRLQAWIPWVTFGLPPVSAGVALALAWGSPLLALDAGYRILYLNAGIVVIFSVGILSRAYSGTRDPVLKAQLKWLLLGHLLGMSPYILLYGLPRAVMGASLISYGLSLVPLPLILFSYLFAFYRYRLWDVDRIIHRSLVYGISVALLFSLYLLALGMLHQMVAFSAADPWGRADLLLLLGAALLFNPLKNLVQRAMDRALFPEKLGFPMLLMEGSARLSRSSSIGEIEGVLLRDLPGRISVDRSALALRKDAGDGWDLRSEPEGWMEARPDLLSSLDALSRGSLPQFWGTWGDEDESPPPGPFASFKAMGAAVIFPMKSGEDLWGFYVLGDKTTSQLLSSDEIRLVRTLCTQAAHMVGNVRLMEGLHRTNRALADLSHRMIEAKRMADLGEGAAILAHELKSPLGIARGSAEILLKADDPAEREEAVRFILDEVDRLARTVDEFLQFARMSPPAKADADINDLVQSVAFLWESRRKREAPVSVHFDLDPRAGRVSLDPRQIYQVLLNLFANAEDAMEGGGDMIIKTGRTEGDHWAWVVVQDAGKGISPEQLPRVFERFYTTKESGLGLGLTVVQKIMEAHGGEVSIESAPGHGTKVALQFPTYEQSWLKRSGPHP